jgi:hypothetical protein
MFSCSSPRRTLSSFMTSCSLPLIAFFSMILTLQKGSRGAGQRAKEVGLDDEGSLGDGRDLALGVAGRGSGLPGSMDDTTKCAGARGRPDRKMLRRQP